MKETRFIAQNKEKWLESENLLADAEKDPEKLSNLFTQVVDDLSYSRTYYPNRSVRVYLNKIAREYFSIIYSHQKEKRNRFALFWLDELPQVVIHCRKQLIISLVVFTFSIGIGVFSSFKDSHFTSTILGESYVSMTKENIEKGDPMSVYKKGHQVDMFLGITFNNLKVAFLTYIFGLFFSIGTLGILLSNGVMVGCFQFFFVEHGLFTESALAIWLHGTLEISSIVIAGGAGLTLGSGLIFPGSYSRMQAFQISAMRSLKLMLGIAPVIVLAAIIESFLTRYTEAPDFLRLLLIIVSASFIVGYFIIYPWFKSKKGFDQPLEEVKLQFQDDEPVHYDRIKNSSEILKDAFQLYKTQASALVRWIVVITAAMAAADFFATNETELRYADWWVYLLRNMFYALKTPDPIYILINSLGSCLIIYRVLIIIDSDFKKTKLKLVQWNSLLKTFIITTIMYAALYYLEGWGFLILVLCFGILLLYMFAQLTENKNLFNGFSRTFNLLGVNFGNVIGLELVLLLMSFSFLLILSAPILYINTSILQWNFAETDKLGKGIIKFIEIFTKTLAFNLILPLLAASVSYLYFSLEEMDSASALKKMISLIGTKSLKRS